MMSLVPLTANLLFAAAALANVAPQRHPHFDDAGTLQWQTTLVAAKAEARKADRLIFVEYGRAA